MIDHRRSREWAEALAAELSDRVIAVAADVTDRARVGALFATAGERFWTLVTTVVNNALADLAFYGDASSDVIRWGKFTGKLRVPSASSCGHVPEPVGRRRPGQRLNGPPWTEPWPPRH